MSNRAGNSGQTWTGLLVDSPQRTRDERSLRDVLGADSVLLLVRESDTPVESIRKILSLRSSSILTLMGDSGSPNLDALLKIAGTLSSVRRIVVLHDASASECSRFRRSGVLMLRDSPEIRRALRELVARESGYASHFGSQGSSEKSERNKLMDDFSDDQDDGAADQEVGIQASPGHSETFDRSLPVAFDESTRRSRSRVTPAIRRIERSSTDEPPCQMRGASA